MVARINHIPNLIALSLLTSQILLNSETAAAQTLAQVRGEIRSGSSSPPPPKREEREQSRKKQRSHFSDDPSDCDDFDDDPGLWAQLLTGIVKAPFTIPRWMAEDRGFETGYFPRYPYLHGSEGYVTDLAYAEEGTDPLLIRMRAEYFDDFDSLSYWGGSVLLDTAVRLGFDSEFYYRKEDLPAGDDSLWNGDANIVFRFAQSEKMQMRAGLGLNWLTDDEDTDFGMNFTYGGDWFPADPWIFSAELDAGKLGSADLLHLRSTLGAQYHRVELFSGYDYLAIGQAKIHGPVFGLRLWY